MTFFYKVLDNEFYKHKNEIYTNKGYSPLIIYKLQVKVLQRINIIESIIYNWSK